MNPYLVLGVATNADDQEIRRAYLEAVKEATPDSHPERFKAVSEAYAAIKDEPSRLKFYLFNKECPGDSPLDVFIRFTQFRQQLRPLPFEAMKEYLRACSKT